MLLLRRAVRCDIGMQVAVQAAARDGAGQT